MNKRRCRIIMLCAIIGTGVVSLVCERSAVETYDPELNIYSVLQSDHAFQRVIVDRTYRMDEPAEDLIDDALVVLTSWASVDTLIFDGTYFYWAYYVIVQPLSEYNLMVCRDGFDTVYARTIIPGAFAILYPHHFDTLTFSDTIILSTSEHAAVYAVSFDGDEFDMFFEPPDTSDSLMYIPLSEVFAGWSPGNFFCRIWVAACDSNFYRYYGETNNDPYETGITGGVGLFGSLWICSVDMFVNMVQDRQCERTYVDP